MNRVEQVIGVATLNLDRDLHVTDEELILIRSFNPHEVLQVQRRCWARAESWKRMAKLIRRLANGRDVAKRRSKMLIPDLGCTQSIRRRRGDGDHDGPGKMRGRGQMRDAIETLLSVAQPPPVIPVRLWHDGKKWRKVSWVSWELASTNRDTLEEWWREWPEAKPGIPLAMTDLVAIDLEDPADPAFREAWRKPEKVVTFKGRPMLVPECYSIYKTPSGGRHIVFRQPEARIAGRFRWSEGVEILANCLLTLHDPSAILYPRVAQRAVLPEAFRQPFVSGKPSGET
jgi:hypothetical protein